MISSFSFLLFTAILFVGVTQAYYSPPDPETYYLNVTFDHFNASDDRTFPLRYLLYTDYYFNESLTIPMEERPIFFICGGEADVNGGWQHDGMLFEFGQHLGALMMSTEHRFYGDSLPFGPVDSYIPSNLAKLTVQQALEDFNVTIAHVKNKYNISSENPLLASGGSYPGELSAYFRTAYPNVVDMALASSAPLLYKPFVSNGPAPGSFFEICTSDFGQSDSICPEMVTNATNQIVSSFYKPSERATIQEQLNLCSPVGNTTDDLNLILLWVENAFATLGMENYPYAVAPFPAAPMNASCALMKANYSDATAMASLNSAMSLVYDPYHNITCHNITEEYYKCADITGCGGGAGDPDAMSWDYQSCTQIVSDVDTSGDTMFPVSDYNYTAVVEYCQEKWGVTPNPLEVVQLYNYTQSSHIIFSNGLLDPWGDGGVNYNLSSSLLMVKIAGAAHHLDLRGSDPLDPKSVTDARVWEQNVISGWLQDMYAEKRTKMTLN